MRKLQPLTLSLAIVLSGAACAARLEQRPPTSIAPAPVTAPDTTAAVFDVQWWRQFGDPVLNGLVDGAIAANRDLRAAVARFEAASELAGAAAFLQLPQGGVVTGAAWRHFSTSEAMPGAVNRTVPQVNAGAGVAWEADLFGRLRGIQRVAAAEAAASGLDMRGVQVAIAAQVASAYFELRGAERDRALIEGLQARTRQHLDTTRTLVSAGRSTRLDLLRAQQVEEELNTAWSSASHRVERAHNRLAVLSGRAPGTLAIEAAAQNPLRATTLAVGKAADVLQRRPDVAAADARVAAALAHAGVARAELFPRVEVTGTIGLVAGSIGRLADAAAGSWLIAPRVVWNVLDWPRLRRQMRAAGAMAEAAFADYEQTVLQALEESRTAMDAYAAANRALAAQERRAQASTDAAGVVFIQYREGLVDSLATTQADRDAIAGALDANRALTAQRLAVVNVYRALGGGW